MADKLSENEKIEFRPELHNRAYIWCIKKKVTLQILFFITTKHLSMHENSNVF